MVVVRRPREPTVKRSPKTLWDVLDGLADLLERLDGNGSLMQHAPAELRRCLVRLVLLRAVTEVGLGAEDDAAHDEKHDDA